MGIKIQALRDHFFEAAKWVDRSSTCDQIIYGSPNREVSRIGTGWVPCAQNLEAAARDGCELFISHETFFYEKWSGGLDSSDTSMHRRRMDVLKKSRMACMNQHDTWDNFPVYGIRDSWRSFLGLSDLIAERPYCSNGRRASGKSLALCRVTPQRMDEFAGSVAGACSVFPSFAGLYIYGNPDALIGSVATGAGCHIPTLEMLELGADLLVLTFDRALQTAVRIPLAEMGARMIVVEHGVSEMPGMKSMAEYLEKTFPGIKAKFYCNEPAARAIPPACPVAVN